ncbi:hypothetical protein SB725_32495, partial [Pseudomonas sp. SIMBA_041]
APRSSNAGHGAGPLHVVFFVAALWSALVRIQHPASQFIVGFDVCARLHGCRYCAPLLDTVYRLAERNDRADVGISSRSRDVSN